MYKIKSRKTGLFPRGGSSPTFNKSGKVWMQRGHLSNHFGQLYDDNVYDDHDVVIIEIVEGGESIEHDFKTWRDEVQKRANEREAAARRQAEEYHRQQRYKQYLKLKAEFEP